MNKRVVVVAVVVVVVVVALFAFSAHSLSNEWNRSEPASQAVLAAKEAAKTNENTNEGEKHGCVNIVESGDNLQHIHVPVKTTFLCIEDTSGVLAVVVLLVKIAYIRVVHIFILYVIDQSFLVSYIGNACIRHVALV